MDMNKRKIADKFFRAKNYAEAEPVYKELAESGDVFSMWRLALVYEYLNQIDQELIWLEKASELGHRESQTRLGATYLTGLVVPRDVEKAISLLDRASEQGDLTAQLILGGLYANGDGVVDVDYDKARFYFAKAADQGSLEAKEALEDLSEE